MQTSVLEHSQFKPSFKGFQEVKFAEILTRAGHYVIKSSTDYYKEPGNMKDMMLRSDNVMIEDHVQIASLNAQDQNL